MNTLGLVRANDHVLQSTALLNQEHSVRISALGLLVAGTRTPVVPGVRDGRREGLAGSDRYGFAERAGLGWRWENVGRGAPFDAETRSRTLVWCQLMI